jgi:tetratricopeptide (TPR) repeat protein
MRDRLPDTYKYDVFISCSTADKDWVRRELLTQLQGLRIFEFQLGASRANEIERAVVESRKTLLVLTPDYVESEWEEFGNLLVQSLDPASRNQRFIPILKQPCELPLRLQQLIPVDLTDPNEDEIRIAWAQLLTALGKKPVIEPPQEQMPQQWFLAHPYGMPPHFTGRNAERQLLSAWLQDATHPLLVLRALGGFGKSALTWHWLLHDVAERDWQAVVWWSFYEEKAGFDNFVYATLAYLSRREPQELNPRERVARLLEYVRQDRILLVLDGFERELRAYGNLGAAYQGDGEQDIADAGRDCVNPHAELFLRNLGSLPGLKGKVLMSTRLRPRSVEVTGGALLLGCREEELMQMQAADAVAFFRVQGIRGNRGEIEQACRDYGFHPLSLRLLAGLVVKDLRNPGDIQAAQRKDLMGSLVQRQNHVLAQSYGSLSLDGRQLLSRIACFRSPVAFEVLEALAAAEPDWEGELQDLMERGLVQREGTRFDLHPIVRRYAYDLMGTAERSSIHSQMRDYFAAVPAVERVTTLDDLASVIELYHHMMRAEQYDEAWKLFYDRLAKPLYYQFGANQLCIELLRPLCPQSETQQSQLQSESAQAWTLNMLANSYSLNGQPAQAVPLFEQVVEISKKREDKKNGVINLGNLALDQIRIGTLQAAEANLRCKIALCQEIEDEPQESVGHQALGRLLAYRGAWGAAAEASDRALELFEKYKQIQFLGITWGDCSLKSLLWARSPQTSDQHRAELAAAALAAAQVAIAFADETVRDSRFVYPMRDYVCAHWLLGAAHRLTPNLPESDRHLSEALRRCRAINLVDHEADILLDLARLRRDQSDLSEAHRLAEEARTIATRSGYVLQGADSHLVLAELAQAAGNLLEAQALTQRALQLATCDGGEFVYRVAYDEAVALQVQLGG